MNIIFDENGKEHYINDIEKYLIVQSLNEQDIEMIIFSNIYYHELNLLLVKAVKDGYIVMNGDSYNSSGHVKTNKKIKEFTKKEFSKDFYNNIEIKAMAEIKKIIKTNK